MSTSWVKRRLREHGYWPRVYPINNGYGKLSRAAVMRFQKARGLEVDGIVGPQTIAALKAPRPSRERARALKWANDAVGVTEHPPGSNDGPRIRKWWLNAGYNFAVPYCCCFTSCALEHATRGRIRARQLGGYCPTVVAIARQGSLGFQIVKLRDALPGDLCFFDFGHETYDHVGLFVKHDGPDHIRTIEANTSPDSSIDQSIQAQANGGGVYRRRRSNGLVSAVVRPPYRA